MTLEKRPWGFYVVIAHTPTWWLKLLVVKGRTSLQKHSERTERIFGTRGYKKIEPESWHRLKKGVYIEYASGAPKEADIVRIEDDYGRI